MPHIRDKWIDRLLKRRVSLSHGGGHDVGTDAAIEVRIHIAECLGCEVMRPADNEIGMQSDDLLAAWHIGRGENRERGIGIGVCGRLRAVGCNRADDAIREAEVDQQLRCPRIGDEHALRRMRKCEVGRAPLAVRRRVGDSFGDRLRCLCAAPVAHGEREDEHGAREKGQESQGVAEASQNAPVILLCGIHCICSVR